MKILYVGDVVGEPGLEVIEQILPGLRKEKQIDLVVAQAENVSSGKGTTVEDFRRLQALGVDFCSGGNWSLAKDVIFELMNNPDEPIIRPANYPEGTAGLGWKYLTVASGQVLVISLLGQLVGRDANRQMQNPLQVIDKILDSQKNASKLATVVNFHGDYSSEKIIIGHYLDGRVTAVVGDHWHVPTADVRVLPKGTAHISDIGMCGALNSSLGVKLEPLIDRWRDGVRNQNDQEQTGPRQFNAILVESNEATGLAKSAEHIQKYIQASA